MKAIDPNDIRVGDRCFSLYSTGGKSWVTVLSVRNGRPTGVDYSGGGQGFGSGILTPEVFDHLDDPYIRRLEDIDSEMAKLAAEHRWKTASLGVVEVEVIAYDPECPPIEALAPEGRRR